MQRTKSNSFTLLVVCLVFTLLFPMCAQATQKVELNKKKMTIVVGQQKTLKLKNTTKEVTWSSSKKSVAKVNKKGVVTAKKAGTATITAKVGKKKYSCVVTVKEKPSLNMSETICVGKEIKLKVEGTAKKVKWSSSNRKIVKVDQRGKIKGMKKGTAVITAQVGDKTLKCKVKVKDAVIAIKRTIKVEDAGFVVVSHYSDSVFCKVSDPDIAEIAVTDWELSDDGPARETTIAIYAKKSGTTYITVGNDCNKKKMKFKVVVKKTASQTPLMKLKNYVIDHGDINSDCNKVITKSFSNYQAKASVIYDYWEDAMNYEYEEIKDGTEIKWYVLGAEESQTGAYIVMWVTKPGETESEYITAEVDLASYNGKDPLTYEEAWFGVAVNDELQSIGNEVTSRAYTAINELLKPTGMTFSELFSS